MIFRLISIVPALSVLLLGASASATEQLSYDPDHYDVAQGCFDADLKVFRRIQLATASEIQRRIDSRDFECTEMANVIVEAIVTSPMLTHGDFPQYKVVGITGTGGSLGSAGIYNFNFKGSKITNLFLDYQVAIGGDASGIVAKGVHLAFYAQFSTEQASKNCHKVRFGDLDGPLPSYTVRTPTDFGIFLLTPFSEQPEFRGFSADSVICTAQ